MMAFAMAHLTATPGAVGGMSGVLPFHPHVHTFLFALKHAAYSHPVNYMFMQPAHGMAFGFSMISLNRRILARHLQLLQHWESFT